MKSKLTLLLVLTCLVAFAQNWTRYEAQPSSRVKIEGTSTVHDWTVESQLIGGFMELDSSFPLDRSAAQIPDLKVVPKVQVNIPVRSIKSGKTAMDTVMHNAMKQKEHPKIEYKLLELTPRKDQPAAGPLAFDAKGELTVAGVKKTITMPVVIEPLDKTRVKVTGTANLKMTDFGIQPPAPKLALGLISTGDDVKITFEWLTAQKSAEPKPAGT